MSPENEQMLKVLKERLEPELRRRRFTGQFPTYRRFTPHKTDVLSVSVDERSKSFRVEVAELPPRDFSAPNGVWVALENATTFDALTSDRARLRPQPGKSKYDFIYGSTLFLRSDVRFERAADSVVALLPQADAWWKGERHQPNVWAGG